MAASKTIDAGERPELKWMKKGALRIDARYQREVSTKRGQALVGKLVEGWRWAHCLPLVITNNFDGTYNVIDGQHRLSAALERDDINELPCYIIATETLQDEAEAFVAYNRDRVQLTPLAVYHAMVAAKDPQAIAIAKACRDAGVVVLKTPTMVDLAAANEAQCIGAFRSIERRHGGGHLGRCLKILVSAWPGEQGSLRAPLVHGVAELVKTNAALKDGAIIAALGERDPEQWLDRARGRRAEHNNRTVLAFAADLLKLLVKKAA